MPVDLSSLSAKQARSRLALHRAFERQIEVVDFRAITVSALAREAGVGRPTFYRLYDDVNELLVDCVGADLDAQWRTATEEWRASGPSSAVRRVSTIFALDAMAAKPRLYLALLDGSGGANAVTIFRAQVVRLMTLFPAPSPGVRDIPDTLRSALIASAISGFMLAWLERDCTPSPDVAAPMIETLLQAAW